jgi:hypothetical protein
MKLILSWVSCQKKHGRTSYIYNIICINILYAHLIFIVHILVGGFNPLKNMSSSVGMILPNMNGKS